MQPAWEHGKATLYQGSADAVFAALPSESVHAVVCSPPYFGLRSYNTAPVVWDGVEGCEHEWTDRRYYVEGGGTAINSGESFSVPGPANAARIKAARWRADSLCTRCNAWRGELGAEPTPDLYVRHLVAILRAVRRVLRCDGTLWLNVADSYNSGAQFNHHKSGLHAGIYNESPDGDAWPGHRPLQKGIPSKNLCLVPERLSIALQEDGWIIRSKIRWIKTAPMPESVTDRPTSAVEEIFMLAKSPTYFYDAEAVREPGTQHAQGTVGASLLHKLPVETTNGRGATTLKDSSRTSRNQRNY
ncbi:MAG TPA: DNA methyltransferase, partial [Chloroflexota bacterium]